MTARVDPQRRAVAPVVPAVLAVLALLLAVLGAGLRGPWTADPPRVAPPEAGTPPPVTEMPSDQPTLPPNEPPPVGEGVAGPPEWVGDVVVALAIAATLGLAILVAHRLWLYLRNRRAVDLESLEAGSVSTATVGEVEDLPDLAPALRRAARALGEGAAPADAIVSAWVALEETAAASGAARSPADTPTEFTARLLRRTAADPDAVARLREVYRSARFGTRAPGDDDVRAAARAVARIEATWEGR